MMDIALFLNNLGIYSDGWIELIRTILLLLIVSMVGWLSYFFAKKWLAKIIIKIAGKTKAKWGDLLFDNRFFNRLALFITPVAISIVLKSINWEHIYIFQKIIAIWIVIASVLLITSILDGIVRIYDTYSYAKDRPIKVFMQIILIFLWCAALMIIVSIFTGKSVMVLLGGLAAFAAVLMLIFQDSILGFVAGIQLSANNMVRIGDWIVMPGRNLDGDVIEIGLTTVKVQNFDKTITTVPTHKLVTESFTNWKGMVDSGGRRIKRSINIDVRTIKYLTEEDIKELKRSVLLKEYIEKKEKEIVNYNTQLLDDLDKRQLTNVGTFREYIESWLKENPKVNNQMTCMVRQLQPTPTGLPLEIYCFTSTTAWLEYEAIQADIFDRMYSIMPLFGLKAFQYSGGMAE